MISYWYLSAVCCIPLPNPAARLREREIFRLVPPVLPNHKVSSRFARKSDPKKPSERKLSNNGITLSRRVA
jgi:hypothetical protein